MKPMYNGTKTVAIAAQKGGSGKTTIGIHLAVLGARKRARILLMDTDNQQTMTKWWDRRQDDNVSIVSASAGRVTEVQSAATEEGIDLLLVDTPPHAASQIEEVIRHSDFVLIPCRPTPFDLEAMAKTVEIAQRSSVPAFFVLNQVTPRGKIVDEALEYIKAEYGLPVCPVTIGHRVGLIYATIDGKAIIECEPNSKAAGEFSGLWKFVDKKLKGAS